MHDLAPRTETNGDASWRGPAGEHVRSVKTGEGVRAYMESGRQRVADVFYVADAEGGKIRDEGRLEGLREALHRELDPKDDGRTRAAG